MKSQVLALAIVAPLFAYALPKKCGEPYTSWVTVTTTAGSLPTSQVQESAYPTSAQSSSQLIVSLNLTELSTFSVLPTESFLPGTASDYYTATTSNTVALTSTVVSVPETTAPSSTAVPTATTTLSDDETTAVPSTAIPTSTAEVASQVVSNVYSEATQVAFKVAATEQCGDNDILSLPGMPWTVANSMYNADQMVGSQCTNFDAILQATDGTKEVQWTSVTDIELVDSTKDLCKGYTNIGIGVNLNKKLSAITSIPAYFAWDRANTTEFKGKFYR